MADETHSAEAASSGLPQLDFTTWPSQIFWLAVALVALFFMMSRFVLPRIAATLQERRDTIVSDLDIAAEFDQKTREAEAALAAAMEQARAEARRIADKTQASIQSDLDAALAAADARIQEQTAESAARIRAIEAEARTQAAAVASDAAEAIVGRFSPSAADVGAVRAAVETRITERLGA